MFLLVCAFTALSFILSAMDPMTMGLGLAVYSLLVSVLMSQSYFSYYAFFLFFVYVGTLMVMFCMVVSLAPNPVFRLTPLIAFWFFFLSCSVLDSLMAVEDPLIKLCGGYEEWGDIPVAEKVRFVEWSDLWLGGVYESLGSFGGFAWGSCLVYLGLALLLSIISVANMSKRSRGPLVRFVFKSQLKGKFKLHEGMNMTKPSWKMKKEFNDDDDEYERALKKRRGSKNVLSCGYYCA